MAGTRRLRKASDCEARPAAAAGGGIGIFDLDRRSAERIDEIDRAAAHEVEADWIDDHLHPVGFGAAFAGVDAVGSANTTVRQRVEWGKHVSGLCSTGGRQIMTKQKK